MKPGDKVKVIKSSKSSYWYAHKIGSIFTLDGKCQYGLWRIKEDYNSYLDPQDIELISEQPLILEEHPLESYPAKDSPTKEQDALSVQVGGGHYKGFKIQPVEYIYANNIPFLEGNVIKYTSRHKDKNKAADIKKAIHCLELILQLEYPDEV